MIAALAISWLGERKSADIPPLGSGQVAPCPDEKKRSRRDACPPNGWRGFGATKDKEPARCRRYERQKQERSFVPRHHPGRKRRDCAPRPPNFRLRQGYGGRDGGEDKKRGASLSPPSAGILDDGVERNQGQRAGPSATLRTRTTRKMRALQTAGGSSKKMAVSHDEPSALQNPDEEKRQCRFGRLVAVECEII
jgi:hypothetical protein